MLISEMGSADLSNRISAVAKSVVGAAPDFTSIRQNIEELIALAESSDAPRGGEVADILRQSVVLIGKDGARVARDLLGLAALKIKDHSREP